MPLQDNVHIDIQMNILSHSGTDRQYQTVREGEPVKCYTLQIFRERLKTKENVKYNNTWPQY